MPGTFTIPDNYHFVVAAMSLPAIVSWGQAIVVGKLRYKADVPYPQTFADKAQAEANRDAHIFNCAQRAHQHTQEGLPLVVLSTAIAGLRYPLLAAGVCAFWAVTRIPFTLGYMTGDPNKRGRFGARHGFSAGILLSVVAAFVAGKRLVEAHAFDGLFKCS